MLTVYDLPCIHRAHRSHRSAKCNLCGKTRGQPVVVYRCAVHGECTVSRMIREIQPCASCLDVSPPMASSPSDPQTEMDRPPGRHH